MSRWIYLQDPDGRPIPKPSREAIGYGVVPCRPTPPHALSNPVDEREEEAELEGKRQRKLQALTFQERAVVELQTRHFWLTDEKLIPKDDFEAFNHAVNSGYEQVGYDDKDTLKMERTTWRTPTYEEIGLELGLSARQVHRRVVTARRKLRGTR